MKQLKLSTSTRIFSVSILSLLAMLPIWPVDGLWFGLPAWAVLVVLGCAMTSCWIAYAALFRWRDLEGTDSVD